MITNWRIGYRFRFSTMGSAAPFLLLLISSGCCLSTPAIFDGGNRKYAFPEFRTVQSGENIILVKRYRETGVTGFLPSGSALKGCYSGVVESYASTDIEDKASQVAAIVAPAPREGETEGEYCNRLEVVPSSDSSNTRCVCNKSFSFKLDPLKAEDLSKSELAQPKVTGKQASFEVPTQWFNNSERTFCFTLGDMGPDEVDKGKVWWAWPAIILGLPVAMITDIPQACANLVLLGVSS